VQDHKQEEQEQSTSEQEREQHHKQQQQSVREAAEAIPAMTGRNQLICEELHWRYCRRYYPQLAKMAHGMAGGGSRDDFENPEFVQKWSCFIFYMC
jgi:hypothetical protein